MDFEEHFEGFEEVVLVLEDGDAGDQRAQVSVDHAENADLSVGAVLGKGYEHVL
jgi:hypothetical protein